MPNQLYIPIHQINLWTKILFTVVFLSFLNNYQIAQTGLPFIYNYESNDYEAGIQNWDITQDNKGRIFIANNFGLLIYDGKNWQRFNSADGTKLRTVVSANDRIYAGSQKDFGYYEADDHGRLAFISLADSLSTQFRDFDEIWKVYILEESIYFCGFDFIFKYENGHLDVVESDYNLEISFLNQGKIYTQQWTQGLSILLDNGFQLIESGEFFAEKRISGIISFDRNSLLISTFNEGLYLYQNGTIKDYEPLENVSFKGMINNTLLRLRNGSIALGTQNSGLYIFDKDGASPIHLNKSKGLNDNTVNSMFEDSEGFLWLSMNNGLSRIATNSPFRIIDDRHGLNGAGYAAYKYEGQLYVGTNNGLYMIYEGSAKLIPGSEGQVYSIKEIDGILFIGHHKGPMVLSKGKAKFIDDEKGAWSYLKVPDLDNTYLLGTYMGINKITKVGSGYDIERIAGFEESSRVMAFDEDELWVSQGYKGAFKLQFDQEYSEVVESKLYNSDNGFPTDLQINVFKLGNELIFGSEGGLFEYKVEADSFVSIAKLNSIIGYENTFVDMDIDELGNIYYLSGSQIGKLKNNGIRDYQHEKSLFNPILSYWNDDLGNIHAISSEEILIGASEGFISYDPKLSTDISDSDFIAGFSKILINGRKDSTIYSGFGEQNASLPTFDYSNNNINFEYFASHFGSIDQVVYAWQLNDFTNTWSDWSEESRQTFTNLDEGEYTFKVKAKNIYDVESNVVEYRFSVAPPFYRSPLAYSVYTAGTFILMFLIFKTLDQQYKKKTKALKDSKDAVISQKEAEILTVSEKSEAEIVKLRNDKLETEIKLKSQSLTSSAMNLIQKNQLLSQIKNTLKHLTQEEEKVEKKELRKIIKSIERDITSKDEWEQFERNFDEVHGQFLTRLKKKYPTLTPQELKFSAYLRMNLNTKEMANLLNISVRGVEIGRYRVRKKLGLERKDNLSDFILRF